MSNGELKARVIGVFLMMLAVWLLYSALTDASANRRLLAVRRTVATAVRL